MNTPTHIFIALAAVGRVDDRVRVVALSLGALAPDLPMLVFYAWMKISGATESQIWSRHYYETGWQGFIDVFNSVPLMLLGLGAALAMRLEWLKWFCIAALLHVAFDLPVHHDDAHRHFLPFSDWRFASPVSYWDARHYGSWVFYAEALFSLLAFFMLWRLYRDRVNRGIVFTTGAVYLGFLGFALLVWR